ncbi:hypothetical protein NQ317_008298 [Molorchus minor]|uniref:Uncharacterized protein n=1 Tax=Molorchus minor TaxID=1323400 RepID=A0ABQ9J0T6_9CUCU|nr:hypothetical protein NQ317_008298 [Molorchus minor]
MITDKPSSTLTTGNVGVNIVKMLGINKWWLCCSQFSTEFHIKEAYDGCFMIGDKSFKDGYALGKYALSRTFIISFIISVNHGDGGLV